MALQDCIFCKIIAGDIPAKVIKETDDLMVIQDIAPKSPVHYLIFPKKHIADITSVDVSTSSIVGSVALMAKELAHGLSGSQSFRLITNTGADSGQSVFHLHFHFLSGKKMLDF